MQSSGVNVFESLVYTLKEAAKRLGVCTKTLRREIDAGRLKAFFVGRQLRIRAAELEAYMKRGEDQYARGG